MKSIIFRYPVPTNCDWSQNEDSIALGGDETQQRVETLKTKRQNDRINFILSAAAKGDLAGLKHALRVSQKHCMSAESN